MIKSFLTALLLCCLAIAASAQTLFTYGNQAVSKQEFLRAYNKNKTPVENKEKAIRDYLELYGRFKLKVQAAKDQRLDTLLQLGYDLQNFKSQVEEGYLNDEKGIEKLLDEVFQRSQRDIHLLHFSVPVSNKMDPADTLAGSKALRMVRDELIKGNTNYDDLIDVVSQEVYKVKGTDLGFITALQLPYQFENVAYGLKAGEVSQVIRTKSGLHVFKNSEDRPSAGRWKVAQILLSVPPDVTGEQLKKLEQLADSLYTVLQQGADFATIAKQYSDDKLTFQNGGILPEFGTGKFEFPFEQKVFALQKDGDISKPIFTGYGFHIVKRVQQRALPATLAADENYTFNLRQQLMQDKRIAIPKANFIKEVIAKTGYKKNAQVKDELLFKYADSVVAKHEVISTPISNKIIFSFSKLNVKGSDWLNFVHDYKLNADVYHGETNTELLDKYVHTAALEYYRNHLEEFSEDFKYQIQEFKEGNMLFETMERNVWSKATSDSAGLVNYYNANKTKYIWAESADVLIFNASSLDAANQAAKTLQQGASWRQLADESEGKLQADSGRFEIAQIQLPEGTKAKPGFISTPVLNTGDNTASFVQILQLHAPGQQRSFEEAKGLVINDYQGFLEEEWINGLKKKYPIKVNQEVLQTIIK